MIHVDGYEYMHKKRIFSDLVAVDQRKVGSDLIHVGEIVGYHGNKNRNENVHGDNVERYEQKVSPAGGSTIRKEIIVRLNTVGILDCKVVHHSVPSLSNKHAQYGSSRSLVRICAVRTR